MALGGLAVGLLVRTGVVEVVQAAHRERGHAVEGGVEAVVWRAGAIAGPVLAVVDLAEVARAVPALPQQLGERRHGLRGHRGVREPVRAPALLVLARDEARARRAADRCGHVRVVVQPPRRREGVEVRGGDLRIAAAQTQIAVPVVVRDDQQDVRALALIGGATGRARVRHPFLRPSCAHNARGGESMVVRFADASAGRRPLGGSVTGRSVEDRALSRRTGARRGRAGRGSRRDPAAAPRCGPRAPRGRERTATAGVRRSSTGPRSAR